MTIDWNAFTPGTALAGGCLIGLAAGLLVLAEGRIAGISGVLGGLLRPAAGDIAWRAAFLLGLVASPWLLGVFRALPSLHIDTGTAGLVVAGVLVGIGTRYGSGCTSGHGVCGFARLSPRSMAAVAAFMSSGFATVWLLRHALVR